jgi:hypothetical protein
MCRLLSVLALASFATPVQALDGPRAEFAIDADGFLTVRVSRDGAAPLPCRVRAVTPSGHVWAEGQTASDGICEFPRPQADSCRIEFDLGGTPSPPVELTFLDGGTAVIPLVAPLTPGPCCARTRESPAPASTDPPRAEKWSTALGVVSVLFFSLGILAAAARWSPARISRRTRRHR